MNKSIRQINVLHVNTLDTTGGAAQVANDLIEHTHTHNSFVVGFKTSERPNVIVFRNTTFVDFLLLAVDKIRSLFRIHTSIRIKLGLNDMWNGTYSKLKKMKAYQEADVVHLHNIHGGFFDLDALPHIAREKKIVWTLHDMWMLTGGEAYTFDNDNFKLGIAETPFTSYYPLSDPYVDRRKQNLDKKKKVYQAIATSTCVVPVSYWLERCVRQSYVFENNIKVQTIFNGVNLSVFRNRRERDWKRPRVLFFNSNNPFKGSHLFREIEGAVSQPFDLNLIGDTLPGREPRLRHQFISSRQQLADIYNQSDILVFPSLAENLALTVIEAMACGVCVIASDAGGIPEILQNDYGYLFRVGDSSHLLEKLNLALSDTAGTRSKGLQAEKVAREKFDLSRCAAEYEQLYLTLLNGKTNPGPQANPAPAGD
jgi:glycosyltransferase involved in cell wall biosynthesis